MAEEQYIYQVMCIHLREKELLSSKELDRLIAAKDISEAYAILGEKGWNTAGLTPDDAGSLIAARRDKTWAEVQSLLGDLAAFNVLFYANDYHNLKAAIKTAYSQSSEADMHRYLVKGGAVDADVIVKAARSHDFTMLPDGMKEAGRAAYETLAHSGNGQYCDMIIDKAALIAIDTAGKETKSAILKQYADLTVDGANIKAAVRCCKMGKKRDFIERAIAPAGSLDTQALIDAAQAGIGALYDYLRSTAYSEAANELEKGTAAFEKWVDNQIMEMIRPQKYNFFSIEPIIAYILACDIEIRMVKLLLSAKVNDFGAEAVRERLRESYV